MNKENLQDSELDTSTSPDLGLKDFVHLLAQYKRAVYESLYQPDQINSFGVEQLIAL